MGDLTLAQMRTELSLLVDSGTEYDPLTASGQTRCDRALNFTYKRIQRPNTFNHIELQSVETLTLAAGTESYATTLYAIDHARYSQVPRRLNPMTMRQRSTLTLPSGPPTRYTRWGTNIYFDHIPSAAEAGHTIQLFGWAALVSLASTGPASVLNSEWDQAIITGAGWYAWRSLGDQSRADILREEYAALVNDAKDILSIEAHDEGWQVSVGGPDFANYGGSY